MRPRGSAGPAVPSRAGARLLLSCAGARGDVRWCRLGGRGHPARLGPDGLLRRSVDLAKDQSYVLAVLTRDQLDRAIFPLGDSTKAQVRQEAADRGLAVADKPDSHDICFIADGDTRGFLTG